MKPSLNVTDVPPERSERVSRDLRAGGFTDGRIHDGRITEDTKDSRLQLRRDEGYPVASDGPATTRIPPTTKASGRRVVILTRSTSTTTTTSTSKPDVIASDTSMDETKKRAELVPSDKDALESDSKDEDAVEKSANEPLGSTAEPTYVNATSRNLLGELPFVACFAAPGLGLLVGHFPARVIMHKFGARITVAAALLLSGVATGVLPHCLQYGQACIAVVRFVQGLAFASVFTFIGTSAAHWGAVKEQLYFLTISFLALQLAPKLSWSISSLLVEQGQQYWAFQGHATLSLLLVVVWYSFYRDTPQKHRLVNGIELNKICAGKSV
ncbi:Protein T01H3.3, partial [Aphelenchoides avenae]